jgi:hypothetical protein
MQSNTNGFQLIPLILRNFVCTWRENKTVTQFSPVVPQTRIADNLPDFAVHTSLLSPFLIVMNKPTPQIFLRLVDMFLENYKHIQQPQIFSGRIKMPIIIKF